MNVNRALRMNTSQRLAAVTTFVFGALVSATHVQAALVERDFAAANDGLLIFDTLTNREWVDVSHTTNMSVNQFFSTSIYAGQGFQLAKTADITQFFFNAGAATVVSGGSNFIAGNLAGATLLNTLMEHVAPYSDTGGNSWIHGYEDYGSATNLTLSRFLVNGSTATFDIGTNGTYWSQASIHPAVGMFAFRTVAPVVPAAITVPEPASAALVLAALLGTAATTRRSRSAASGVQAQGSSET